MTFGSKMQGIVDKSLAVSKNLASRAKGKARDYSAMGALKIEIMQMKSEEAKLVAKLGNEVYSMLVDKSRATVSRATPSIHAMLKKIEGLRVRNESKEKEYHSIAGKKGPALADA
jgi:hypothetical protein